MQIGVRGSLGDARDGREVLRRRRILEPEQGQVLERASEPKRVGGRVAPVQVEGDVGSAAQPPRPSPRRARPACPAVPARWFSRRGLHPGSSGRSRSNLSAVKPRSAIELALAAYASGVYTSPASAGAQCSSGSVSDGSSRSHPREVARDQRRAVARQRVAGVAVGVDPHAVAEAAAEELPERNVERACNEIPERRLDTRDRVEDRSSARDVGGREVEPPDEWLDVPGVAALDERRELADGLGQGGRAERLTPADETLVALGAHDRPVVVRFDDGRGQARESHQTACSRTILATTPWRSSISANASSNRSSGKRCVTIGSRSTSCSRSNSTIRDHAAVV